MSNMPRIKRPHAKINPAALAELTTLLKQSIEKTEALVSANEELRKENKELSAEVSKVLEELDSRVKKLEEVSNGQKTVT